MPSSISWSRSPPRDRPPMYTESEWPEGLWRVFVLILVVAVPVVILESGMMAWHVPAPEFQVLATDPSRIYEVIPGSGAESAGVQAGDRILQLNGAPFTADDLTQVVRHWTVGET
jgi:hypothetical protein